MTSQTVSQAVEQNNKGPGAMIERYRNDFTAVLPAHIKADQWVRVSQGLLRRNDKLRQAAERNPGSFLSALLDCARLGLEPGDTYHLVPFGSEVTGIVDYTGEIEMIYRAGAVSSVKAEIVHASDSFDYDPQMDRPRHKVDWFGDRGEMVGVYAYAILKDGSTSRVVVMSKADVEKVKAVSKSANAADSPWKNWPDRMWLKTAVKQLAKWVPTSAEYRRELHRVATETTRRADVPAGVDPSTGEVLDAEIVDDDEQAAAEWAEEQARADGAAEAQ